MNFFSVYQHVLPNAKAWRITADKMLRRFFKGLATSAEDVALQYNDLYFELIPEDTTSLDEWEDLFGLPPSPLATSERRERLAAAWRALGGQSPFYIQNVLQTAGFNVFIHEWFSNPNSVNPRNPTLVIGNTTDVSYIPAAGSNAATAGRPEALAGNTSDLVGRFLVNQDDSTPREVPTDQELQRNIVYLCGATYGAVATVPISRKKEFQTLCLKIFPAHLWIGLIVEYN